MLLFIYRQISNIGHQIPKLKYFSSQLAAVFAQSIEARCWDKAEDVVGAARQATTSEWPTLLLPAKVRLIS